jgi:hypothetical protein
MSTGRRGYLSGMAREAEPNPDERTTTRAELLPEEKAVDSADPEAQAREVLRDSDRRTEAPEPTMRRRPEETT